MDTNKRYNQEERLSEKLKSLEQPIGEVELNSFEQILDTNTVVKSIFKFPTWITYLGMTSIVISGFYLLGIDSDLRLQQDLVTEQLESLKGEERTDYVSDSAQYISEVNVDVIGLRNEKFAPTEGISQKSEVTINETNSKDNKIVGYSNIGKETKELIADEIVNIANLNNINSYSISEASNRSTIFSENYSSSDQKTNDSLVAFIKETSSQGFSVKSTEKDVTHAKIDGIKPLESLKYKLDYNYILDTPDKLISNIDIESPTIKRISFGLIYSKGKVLANDFIPHPLDPFFVRVENGNSFGIGFIGQYNLSNRNFLRSKFVYNKFSQLQIIDGLQFSPFMPTSAHLEAIDHELGFGLDYGFSFISDLKGFSLSAGAGASYRHKITTESNNFYTNGETEPIENTTTSNISPFAYNAYLLFEMQLGNIIVGIEPSYTFHHRSVNHKASLMLGAEADYDKRYALTFSFRIN